jgi:hypothetical protein
MSSCGWHPPSLVADILQRRHYLGPTKRGTAWQDVYGVIVLAKPTGRHLPQDGTWLELTRWCIFDRVPNAGSRQWAVVRKEVLRNLSGVTTVVSYSDPSVGHTGALYRACNWWWAPTWHRLRPPPTGNGAWKDGAKQSVKDRWVCALRKDARCSDLLTAKDESIPRRHPAWRYKEPGGVPCVALSGCG